MCVLLTLVGAGTRWFAFEGWRAVPFEIIDEISLVWALKDFLIGDWNTIPYHTPSLALSLPSLLFHSLELILHTYGLQVILQGQQVLSIPFFTTRRTLPNS
jgi:hypothetical protein